MAEIKITKIPDSFKRFLKAEAAHRKLTLSKLIFEVLDREFPKLPPAKRRTQEKA